ncbi:hypothetical protein GCM10010400_46640 [Streptomyces aculeolatus]
MVVAVPDPPEFGGFGAGAGQQAVAGAGGGSAGAQVAADKGGREAGLEAVGDRRGSAGRNGCLREVGWRRAWFVIQRRRLGGVSGD